MATLVCRGLQSCLDPHLVQEPMSTLRFKLVSPSHQSLARSLLDLTSPSPPHCHPHPQQLLEDPKPTHHHHHHPITSSSSSSNPHLGQGLGGWSFLHALSTTSHREPSARPDQEPPVYVHPLARASSLRLSPRSLELCTENLGSESGNIVPFGEDDDGDPRDESKSAKREQAAPVPWPTRQIMNLDNVSKKAKPRTNVNNSNSSSFPPPLTTIANDSIRVRPHREEGRLILEAVRAPQGNRSCLRAERSHGRLRLSFFQDEWPLCFDSEERCDGGEKDIEAGGTEGDVENETAESDVEEEGGRVGEELSQADEDDEDEEEEGEAEQEGDGDDWEEEGMEGSDGIAGGKLGMEMLHHRHRHRHHQRPSCCKGGGGGGGNEHESSKRMFNFKTVLVAFS